MTDSNPPKGPENAPEEGAGKPEALEVTQHADHPLEAELRDPAAGKPASAAPASAQPTVEYALGLVPKQKGVDYTLLDGDEAIAQMKLAPGLKVNLFASEKQFPELAKAVQMAWDIKGRLWVAVWPNYPERTPTSKLGDSIIILEDTKGTGKADKMKVFAQGPQFDSAHGVCVLGTPDGDWVSMGVVTSGQYGFAEGIICGLPCVCKNGEWSVVEGIELDAFSKPRAEASVAELCEERDAVKELGVI